MIRYLDRDDVLVAGTAALGEVPAVTDYGLLESALARPSATVFGLDAYPDVLSKAAALLQSLARNHAFVDGNVTTAWAATWIFLTINGVELAAEYDVDAAECLVLNVATGVETSVESIAESLHEFADGGGVRP
ncbi:type II toxin-antitoxin system death-on-curing family toxin [Mycolicibacterium alvei]|uniref:Toxin Doc n=1 Tax=Mycolicibacterium alvei TaxID=67081 RepID=A0A6N4UZS1_9MYCO|nr:type II toxin-antitoxin system death-on-curing family toxin [Mycolicibacterium alvei]MCV7003490.1 type II toxin-antitoxin system death-on-curing family toxin [Mycolicibacterium alvei]BBX30556.1 toxin Doc [Mycolicibacterium alvei]